jgi:hypothetical protein
MGRGKMTTDGALIVPESLASPLIRKIAREADPRASDVYAALYELERVGNKDAIAEYLADRGFKGHQSAADSCPVALYLRAKTGFVVYISQTDWSVGDLVSIDSFPLPPYVANFVAAFDDDAYPDLVK